MFRRLATGIGLGLGALAGGFGIFSMIGQGDGPIDAAYVWYTPEDPTDWTVSGGPGEVAPALDELSERLTDLDGTGNDTYLVRWEGTKGLQWSPLSCTDEAHLTADQDVFSITGRASLASNGGTLILAGGQGINYGHDGGPLILRGGPSVYGTPGVITVGDQDTSSITLGDGSTTISLAGAQTWTGTITNYDAQTVLAAVADNTPTAITLNEQMLLGRLTGGNVAAVSIGIADNQIVQVDHDSGAGAGVADDDYCKFTAGGVEGRSYAEVRSDINVEDGADVTDAANVEAAGAIMDGDFDGNGWMARTGAGVYEDRTLGGGTHCAISNIGAAYSLTVTDIGIDDDDLLEVDDAGNIAAEEYLRATAGGVEGRNLAERLSDNRRGWFAHAASGQAITTSTETRVQCATEERDTDGWYDHTTYMATPPAGRYRVGGQVCVNYLGADKRIKCILWKNGSIDTLLGEASPGAASYPTIGNVTEVDVNGTDTLSLAVWHNHGSNRDTLGSDGRIFFWGERIE